MTERKKLHEYKGVQTKRISTKWGWGHTNQHLNLSSSGPLSLSGALLPAAETYYTCLTSENDIDLNFHAWTQIKISNKGA